MPFGVVIDCCTEVVVYCIPDVVGFVCLFVDFLFCRYLVILKIEIVKVKQWFYS